MYFFMSKVKISLQVVKFHTNLITRLPVFSHHANEFQTQNSSFFIWKKKNPSRIIGTNQSDTTGIKFSYILSY